MASQPYIPEVITKPALPRQRVRPLLNGKGAVTVMGYHQERVVKFYWMKQDDLDTLESILNQTEYFPPSEGWSYDGKSISVEPLENIPNIKIFNVAIRGERYIPTAETT